MTGSTTCRHHARNARLRGQSGAVLAVGLVLLLVLTVLATAAMQAATVELQMAGNEQSLQHAFRAAEAGIEQAIAAGGFTIDPSAVVGRYDDPASIEAAPIPGTGVPIAGCPDPAADPPARCEYFVRFDQAAGVTALPASDPRAETGLLAYHFVVDAVGVAARGARSVQVQGLYVAAPVTQFEACQASVADCVLPADSPPVRTYWRQDGSD
jgi:hypothetical protein